MWFGHLVYYKILIDSWGWLQVHLPRVLTSHQAWLMSWYFVDFFMQYITHFFFFFFVFLGTPVAYGGSQARGWNRAVAAGLHHTTMPDPSRICNLHHSSWQYQILKPTERGQGSNLCLHVLMDASQIHFHWATMGPSYTFK